VISAERDIMARRPPTDKASLCILHTVNRPYCVYLPLRRNRRHRHEKSANRRFFHVRIPESGLLATDSATETLLELVDTTTCVHHLLLAGVERVTL